MSTPSPRPLSFNAAPLSLYRQLLSIIRWLGKMASATPEELLLCSLLSVGCGLERYRNSKKSLVVELKGITPLTHTHTHTGFDDVSMKRSACTTAFVNHALLEQMFPTVVPSHGWPCQSPLLPVFRWFLNNHRLRPSTIPFSGRAHERGGFDLPLRVFTTALLAAFESSQPGLEAQRGKSKPLKAGSDHR